MCKSVYILAQPNKMLVWNLISVALAASVAAEDLYANTNDFISVIEQAVDGDVIELARGEYDVTEVIKIDSKLAIKGMGSNFVVANESSAVFAFGNMAGYNTTIDGLTVSTATGSTCNLVEPLAPIANFSVDITMATVTDNRINLKTDVGHWHNNRKLVDFYFADCHYAADHTSERMSGGVYKLMGNCNAQLDFSVAFDELDGVYPEAGCGATIEKLGAFASYGGQVEVQWQEYVQKADEGTDLKIPIQRVGHAVTNLLIQIDTVESVVAIVNAEYEHAKLEAAINLVDVGFFDEWNHSKIRLETHLASPYTVEGGQIGTVGRVADTFIAEVGSISTYEFSAACNGLNRSQECIQNVEFDIVTCDLTGEYALLDVQVQCQAETADGLLQECPTVPAGIAPPTIKFFLDTNNFCEVEEVQLELLFGLSIGVYNTDAYDSVQPVFDLGRMSYWQIRLDTSVSGVSLYNAEVTYADRTTDGDCSGFDTYLGDVSGPDNAFTQVYNPNAQTISMPILITAHMACATSDRTGNTVGMNFTVLVDYDDGSARRRRGGTRVGVREAGELYIQEETGVRYTAADLTPRHSKDKEEMGGGSHDNATRVIAACAVVLILCLCCCAVLCALVIRHRRKRYWDARKQRDFITSYSQGSGMNLGQQSSSSKLGGKSSASLKTNAKV